MNHPPPPEESGIALSSKSHASLFYHDEEIICNFQAHIDGANQHISSLEEKLHNSNQDCESTRCLLYESETARQNELQSRMAFQRHLRLEQHRYNGRDEAYRTACQEIRQVRSFNEMLRQEIEHYQNIIESMATKISKYESAASNVIESLKESWGGSEQDEAIRLPQAMSGPGSPASYTLVDEPSPFPQPKTEPGRPNSPSLVIIHELPQFRPQKRRARNVQQGEVKKSRKSKATSRALETDMET